MKGKFVAIVLLVVVLAGTLAPVVSAAFEPYTNEDGLVVDGKGRIYFDYFVFDGGVPRFCDSTETGVIAFCLCKRNGVFYFADKDENLIRSKGKFFIAETDNPILVRAKRDHVKNSMPIVFRTASGAWNFVTSNPLLVVFCAFGLLVLGFRIFHRARRAPG